MLPIMRNTWLLFTLLAIVALASALNLEDFRIDGINQYLHYGKRQQPSGTGTPTPSETEEPPEETSTPPPDESSTPPPPPSTTPTDEPSTTPPTTEPTSPTTTPPTRTTPPPAPSTSPPEESSTPPVTNAPPPVKTFTTVITTKSNGQDIAITSTGRETPTGKPLPQKGNGESGGGLSDSNKKVIGGVVGGVGGAILLGGIALVCWRIWGRKRRVAEDDDDLAANTGAALGDKPHSASTANTPFQSNLEQYHNPGGRPNAAANF